MTDRTEFLIETARMSTKLDDLGDDSYLPGLEQLVASMDAEAQLHEFGALTLDGLMIGHMMNRLRITDWLRDHGEVLANPLERPVFIVGLPRTGTTLLSYLLDQDPAMRSLMSWEALESVPPPQLETFTSDKRITQVRDGKNFFNVLNPDFRVIHHEEADGPTECLTVLAQDFKSIFWETMANVPSYSAWLRSADHRSAYLYHRSVLQVLQSGVPGRWVLKSPAHRLDLDVLLEVYPDALFIDTYRDPLTVVTSMCSLVSSLSGTFSKADHNDYIARHWTELVSRMADLVDDARRRDPDLDARFIDIDYDDLVSAPVEVGRRIYDHIGAAWSSDVERAMTRYVDSNPAGARGPHSYTPEGLGIDRDEIELRFAGYKERRGLGSPRPT